ncbi:MAG: haloacid dehalogenase type II [Sedimenticolaceae bacterium]|nr:haloacid dehalogenase type II [Sedimenticolaceae bacterium]
MAVVLAFDVYGTLIDTNGVTGLLESMVGRKAAEFSRLWRDRQLEYSFRRGLMRRYADFGVCTRDALDHTCSFMRAGLDTDQKQQLLDCYRTLPAFPDVVPALQELEAAGLRLYAFSNGTRDAVEGLLVAAGIRDRFLDIVSVDEIASFKPDPAVYHHFLSRAGGEAGSAWLVSSNPFDVIGAISAGMRAAWVKRSGEALFDPWGIEPTAIVHSLAGLQDAVQGYTA